MSSMSPRFRPPKTDASPRCLQHDMENSSHVFLLRYVIESLRSIRDPRTCSSQEMLSSCMAGLTHGSTPVGGESTGNSAIPKYTTLESRATCTPAPSSFPTPIFRPEIPSYSWTAIATLCLNLDHVDIVRVTDGTPSVHIFPLLTPLRALAEMGAFQLHSRFSVKQSHSFSDGSGNRRSHRRYYSSPGYWHYPVQEETKAKGTILSTCQMVIGTARWTSHCQRKSDLEPTFTKGSNKDD